MTLDTITERFLSHKLTVDEAQWVDYTRQFENILVWFYNGEVKTTNVSGLNRTHRLIRDKKEFLDFLLKNPSNYVNLYEVFIDLYGNVYFYRVIKNYLNKPELVFYLDYVAGQDSPPYN